MSNAPARVSHPIARRAPRGPDLDPLIQVPILEAAAALGLTVRGDRFGPCPACGHESTRIVQVGRHGWHCHNCHNGGGTSKQLLWSAAGGKGTPAEDVAALARSIGLLAPGDDTPRPAGGWRPPPPPAQSVRPRADPREVDLVWSMCRRVSTTSMGPAEAFLSGRGLSPVVDPTLARALGTPGYIDATLAKRGAAWPEWAGMPRKNGDGSVRCVVPWMEPTYGLIGAGYDHTGRLVVLRARSVIEGHVPKEISPWGVDATGAVYADTRGRRLLAGQRDTTSALVITEGLPDTFAIHEAIRVLGEPASLRLAQWGSWSGSYRDELALRVPGDVVVYLATDPDEAGDRYARKWRNGLANVRRVLRMRPPEGLDWAKARKKKGKALDLRKMAAASVPVEVGR